MVSSVATDFGSWTIVKFFQKRQTKRGIRIMYLLHDSASSYKAGSVTSFLNEWGVCSIISTLFSQSSP